MPPARHYSELIVWQLADEIRREVFKLTKRPRFARDFKAQGQADDAINSVCRNIAEGFACETHGEFAMFLVYSVRSLNEVQDAMRGAQEKGYADAKDLALIRQLFRRLFPALGRFIAYLRRTRNRRRHHHRTDQRQGHRTDGRQNDRTDERQ
jgi:four helix bundle protein